MVVAAWGIIGVVVGVMCTAVALYFSEKRKPVETGPTATDYLSDILETLESVLARMPN
jgi:hypothetical protein